MFVDSIGHGQGAARLEEEICPSSTVTAEPAPEGQIADWLRLFVDPQNDVEVRVLPCRSEDDPDPPARGRFFCSETPEDITRYALEQDADVPKGIFFTLNPVKRDRVAVSGKLTNDSDIAVRQWLLVDADPERISQTSSTSAEKARALETIEAVRSYLRSLGWPEPILADSGNGYHLLYRIELEADDCGLVNRCLKALAKRFDNSAVKIDTTVSNASRIVKLYGTVSRKGADTHERPHRQSRVLEVPEVRIPVPLELLDALVAEITASNVPLQRPAQSADPNPSNKAERARRYLEKVPGAITGQRGDLATYKVAWALVVGFCLSPDDAYPLLKEWNQKCQPPWDAPKLRHKLEYANKFAGVRGYLLDRRANLFNTSPPRDQEIRGSNAHEIACSVISGMPDLGTSSVATGRLRFLERNSTTRQPLDPRGLEEVWNFALCQELVGRASDGAERKRLGHDTPGGYRLVCVESKPRQWKLFNTAKWDGFVLLTTNQLETPRLLRQEVQEQTRGVSFDCYFANDWLGSKNNPKGILGHLYETATTEEPDPEDCRDRVVAGLIWSGQSGLSKATSADAPETGGRPRRMADGSVWFKTDYLLASNYAKDFPSRSEINMVLRAVGVDDRKKNGVRYRVLSASGAKALEDLANKGAKE